LLIKYIKSIFWRVAKRLSYIEDARCLEFNSGNVTRQSCVKSQEVRFNKKVTAEQSMCNAKYLLQKSQTCILEDAVALMFVICDK